MTDENGTYEHEAQYEDGYENQPSPDWKLFHSRTQDFADSVVSSVNYDMRRLDPDHVPEQDLPSFGPSISADPGALAQDGGQHHPRYTEHWRRTALAGFPMNDILASNRLVPVPDSVPVCAN